MALNDFQSLLTLTQAFLGGENALTQDTAETTRGEFQAKQLELNAQLAGLSEQSLMKQEQFEEGKFLQKGAQTEGEQKAGYAAEGVSVHGGTAQAEAQETSTIAAKDALQIRTNAFMKAFGYKVQALNDETEAKMVRLSEPKSGLLGALAGFAGSGIKALSSFDTSNQVTAAKQIT